MAHVVRDIELHAAWGSSQKKTASEAIIPLTVSCPIIGVDILHSSDSTVCSFLCGQPTQWADSKVGEEPAWTSPHPS